MAIENMLISAWTTLFDLLPKIAGAIIVLIIGWIAGRIIGKGVSHVLDKIGVDDALLKTAFGKAIEKFPLFNSTLEDKIIKIHKNINIGFAVAVEEGLFVPVIRNVNKMDIVPIAIRRKSILDKIQNKKITMDELSGGTFTISNLGHYNIDFFTSIINPPEAAILSVAKIKERPMVIKGELEIRPSVKLGLSVDHRIINGNMAAQFLEELETLLVNPKILV